MNKIKIMAAVCETGERSHGDRASLSQSTQRPRRSGRTNIAGILERSFSESRQRLPCGYSASSGTLATGGAGERFFVALVLMLSLLGMPVLANTNFTWHFKDAAYDVSDPTEIEVDTNGTGNAQLILQADTHYRSTFDEYKAFPVRDYLGIGWDSKIQISKSGGLFNAYGVFDSRIINGGGGNIWRSIDTRVGGESGKIVTDPSIVAYFGMDNDGWYDAVSGGYGTPYNGASFTPDNIVGSYAGYFDGGLVIMPDTDPLQGATQCTVACWVKLNSYNDYAGFSLARAGKGLGLSQWTAASRTFCFYVNNINFNAPNNSLELGKWMFLAGTWRASDNRWTMYKDGLAITSTVYSVGASITQNEAFRIAQDSGFPTSLTRGSIDDAVVWNRAISSNEVVELYNYRFAQFSPVRFQVRSGTSETNVLSKNFVGRDGTTNTYLMGKSLPSSADFDPNQRYAQYRAHLWAPPDRSSSPYVDLVGLVGDNGYRTDDLYQDFVQGDTNGNITVMPDQSTAGYLGLARLDNGGFSTNGTYTSRVLDGLAPISWSRIFFDYAIGISNTEAGIIGFWRMDGLWSKSLVGQDGTGYGDADWDLVSPKMGTGAGLFNDQSSYVSIPVGTNVSAIEFWLNNENAGDGIMELQPTNSGSFVAVLLTNHVVTLSASTNVLLSYSLYLNGSAYSARLLPGWNHVVIGLNNALYLTNMLVGVARGNFMGGRMDDLAIFNKVLNRTEVNNHYFQGRRESSGLVKAQVRYGNTLPLTNDFSASGDTNAFFTDKSPLGVITNQYLQYKMYFTSDGNGMPAVDAIRIQNDNGYETDDTRDEFNQGTFDGGLTAWYDEDVRLPYLAGPGPANLALALDTTALGNWHIDELSYGGGLEDSTYRSGLGSASGAQPYPMSIAGASCANLDGDADWLTLPTVSLPNDFTFSLWFNTTSTNRSALASSDDGSQYFTMEINGNGTGATVPGQAALLVNGGGTFYVASTRRDLNMGQWHNVAAVRKGSQIHIYIDGERDGTANVPGFTGVGNGSIYVGREGGTKTSYFKGLIDEAAVWNRALPGAEMGTYCSAGFGAAQTGTLLSDPIDATQPAIWQTLYWVADGIYGRRLDSTSDTSLLALWSMEDVAGGSITNSVTGLASTLNNSPSSNANGRIGSCLEFDSGDYVTVNDATLDINEISVEAWVYMSNVVSQTVFDKSDGANNGYAIRTDGSGIPLFKVDGFPCSGYLPICLQKWTHLCGTYASDVIKLYVDGELAGQVTNAFGATPASGQTAYIGGRGAGLFEGRMDEVAVHNRVLKPEEVLDHYKAGAVTLKFQCRVAADTNAIQSATFYGPGKNPATYFTESQGDDMVGDLDLGQFFQFKAYLATEDYKLSPKLSGVKVFVANYPSDNPWVQPADTNGFLFHGELISASHVISNRVGTSAGYQVSQDASRWWYWDSGRWTNAASVTDTNPIGVITANLGSFYDQVCPKTGGVFRFRSFLHSEGDEQMWMDAFTIVASEGRIVVLEPNGTETGEYAWVISVPYPVTWSSTGKVGAASLVVDLYNELGTTQLVNLATNVLNTGVTNVVISGTPGKYKVRVWDAADPTIGDYSDSFFELVANFYLTAPNGGEYWRIGNTHQVKWDAPSAGVAPVVDLWFTYDGDNCKSNAAAWTQIAVGITNNMGNHNTYNWLIPSNNWRLVSEKARMAIVANGVLDPTLGASKRDFSNRNFTNAGIVVTYPAKNQGIRSGNIEPITWTAAGVSTSAVLELWNGLAWAMLGTNACTPTTTNVFNVQLLGRTTNALIRATSGGITGFSEYFTLADINMLSPTGGSEVVRSHWQIGTTNQIKWTSSGASNLVNIKYHTEELGSTNWVTITNNMPNVDDGITTNVFDWIIPGPPSGTVTVRVESAGQTTLYAAVNPFSMSGVQITQPSDSAPLDFTASNRVSWLNRDGKSIVGVDMSYDNGANFEFITNTYTELGPYDAWLYFGQLRRPSDQARIRLRLEHETDPTTVFTDISDVAFGLRGVAMRYPSNPVVVNLNRTVTNGIQWYSALTLESQAQFYYLADGPLSTTSNLIYENEALGDPFFSNTDSGSCSNQANWVIDRSFKPSVNAVIKLQVGTTYSALTTPFTMRGIRILYPNRGDLINIGSTITSIWDYAMVEDSARVSNSVSLAGLTGTFVTNGFPPDSQVDFCGVVYTVDPDSDPTTNAIIKLSVYTGPDTDVEAYSQPFTMRGIKFMQPTAGTNWMIGQTVNIQFMAAGMGASAQAAVYYSPDGVTFDMVNPVTNNYTILDGINTFPWTIENYSALTRMPSTNAHLMIVSGSSTNITRAFTLNGIKILVPRYGDVWAVSDGTNDIIWESVGMAGANDLSFTVDAGTNIIIPSYPYTEAIAAGVAGTNYAWPLNVNAVGKPVRIGLTNGVFTTYSEEFEMVEKPSVRIKSPAPEDYWKVSETNTIEWIRGGYMSNSFRVLVTYKDGSTEQLGVDGVFDISMGVFSYKWGPIPDRLGVARLVVTNLVNPDVFDVFTNFTIAPKFKVNPAFTEQPYALKPLTFFFDTFGSVTSGVDFYYTTDSARSSNSWVHITDTPCPMPVANNANLPFTWTVADARSSVAYLRIQDHSYTQRFSIAKPGPYNDYGPFSILYYQVVWYVKDSVTTQNLTHLSVVESLGNSYTDINSPWTNYYPYGAWDSVWYRENFFDKAVLAWKPQLATTNTVIMERSNIEPDYHVMTDFAYDSSNRIFKIHSWLERSGAILDDPAICTIGIYNSAGNLLRPTPLVSAAHDANGVFWQNWDVQATESLELPLGAHYTSTDLFFAKVEITFAGSTYSAGLTFALRLAAESEQVAAIQAIVDSATSNILVGVNNVGSNVVGLASNVTAYHAQTSGTLSNIQANVIAARTDIAMLSTNMGSITNALGPRLDELTNSISMLAPLTNLPSMLLPLTSNTVSTLARILTRPTTLQYGSTNSILYKTQRGFGGGVTVTVYNASQGTVHSGAMAEIVGGIYQYDLVANWGTNSYTISCADPGPAMDSMIVDVVGEVSSAVPGLLVGLSNQVVNMEGQISNMATTVSTLSVLTNMTTSLSNSLSSLEYALTNGVLADLSNLSNSLAGINWNDIRAISNGVASISNSIAGVNWAQLSGLTNLMVLTNTLTGMNWNDIKTLDTQVKQIYATVSGLGSADLSQMESGLANVSSALDTILSAGVFQTDMTALTRLEQEVGSVNDTADTQTFFGRLTAIEQQVSLVQGKAGDASKKAQSAKGEASKAATGISGLKTSLAKGNMEGAQVKLDEIRTALNNARTDITELGQVKKLGSLYDAIETMSRTIEELAGREGYSKWLKDAKAKPDGEKDEGQDLKTLIKNHEEVKSTLVFIQKLLDEKNNEPVIQAELIGE